MRKRLNHTIILLNCILIAVIIPIGAKAQQPVSFRDVTSSAAIGFTYTFGDDSYVNILESSGSGITIFDYNNDGWMDLLLLNGTYIEGVSDKDGKKYSNSHNELYRNNGNGTFTAVTNEAGLGGTFWSMAASAIDYDNDGDQDLYLLNYGPNVFYRNNGNGTFTDITSKTGLAGPEKLNGFIKWSIGVSWLDYNNDGRLDALVGNFLAFDPVYKTPSNPAVMPHPSEYKGQASMLYEQQPGGSFRDVTVQKQLYFPDSKCMGLTVFDFDSDGDLDIFQANDHQLNFMFRNDKGKYTEAGVSIGVAANSDGKGSGSMHGTIGDVDGDGNTDILVTDLEHGALYRNNGNGLFTDIIIQSGLAGFLSGKGTWGTALFDFDNDGDLDVIAANGTAEELILQYPLLLENDGTAHFRDAGKQAAPYFNTKRSGRGLAVWDFDNDGDMDVIISHLDKIATTTLLRNESSRNNHWLGLYLKGANGPASAIAAKVTVTCNGKKQVLVNQSTTGYLSNSDPRLHVGLGVNSKVDKLEISWSDGKHEVINNVQADRYITIEQGKGIVNNQVRTK
ncbi:MAG: CRTAC1 family protein [Bacteroidales bacterium]